MRKIHVRLGYDATEAVYCIIMEPQGPSGTPYLPSPQRPMLDDVKVADASALAPSLGEQAGQQLPASFSSAPSGAASSVASGAGSPSIASDSDLIEKEWVDAAKAIIEDNRDDPYSQSRAMMLLRADYMKKRYGKVIKIPEN